MNGSIKDLPHETWREVPRIVLGPAICQHCRQEVIYEAMGKVRLGWLHPDGRYKCKPGPK